MPQWAVHRLSGHTGQTSFAALSQTVKTKSSWESAAEKTRPKLWLRDPDREYALFRAALRLRAEPSLMDDFRRCSQ